MAMSGSPAKAGRGGSEIQGLPFIISASSVGTMIEWYDFYLYGILAAFFGQHFLPPEIKFADSFLYSLGVFWLGFVVRPIGAIIFGHLGDLIGRKYTFMLTLVLMGAATFLVGCLPEYTAVGWLAPVLLVALRLIQGLALGGEYGGAATYIAEHAPDHKRGLYTSWIQTTATLGIVFALITIMAFRIGMGDQAFTDYGWRFPFLISAILVVLSGYIRMRLQESPLYAKLKQQGKASANPAGEAFGSGKNWGYILLSLFGATAPEGVVWYTGQFYALAFMATVLKLPYVQVYIILTFALLFGAPFFIVFGWLSDKIGRRNIMSAGFLLAVPSFPIAFYLMKDNADNPVVLTLIVFYLVLLVTMVYGPIAAFLVEFFPARIRYTSMSLPYHIGNGVFGGGVPFLVTLLGRMAPEGLFGIASVPAGLAYPMVIAGLGVIVSVLGISNDSHVNKIWDEVGGAPAE